MYYNNEEVSWIPGYEEEYGCTKSGKVVSYKTSNIKELKGSIGARGYVRVTLNGKAKAVHRLIALTFIPTDDESLHIDHRDENKENNSVSNLRWCTIQQNLEYYRNNLDRVKDRLERKRIKLEILSNLQKNKEPKVIEGNKISVNGEEFQSCRSATSFIVESEALLGYERREDTVRKELRNYLKGLRPSWTLYGRYRIN
jgi:hypothetical protein